MKSTVKKIRRRGPLPTGKGTLVGVRLQPKDLKALDLWIQRAGKHQSRPEAIRRLVSAALVITKITAKLATNRSPFAIELAGSKINSLLYPKEFADLKFELLTKKPSE
jgi:Arc/MetJ-type ribon-helix-helix transcriptional regulator